MEVTVYKLWSLIAAFFSWLWRAVRGLSLSTEVYLVTVPADRTLAQMIEAGKYDWVAEEITPESFPDVGPTGEYELVLVHIKRVVSTEEAVDEIKKLGLEPAYIGMLLAFGEKYPEVQRKFLVVGLDSSCVDAFGCRYSPCLDVRGRGRSLRLGWVGLGWDGHYCRFLAYRKKVAK